MFLRKSTSEKCPHFDNLRVFSGYDLVFNRLDNLLDPDIEALWAWLRPSRLPCGVPCLIAAKFWT